MVGIVAGLAVGLLVGLVAGFLAADWIQDSARRQAGVLTPRQRYELARLEHTQDDDDDYDSPAYLRLRANGERALGQPFPYQPPVFVIAAPRAQAPQVVPPGTAVTRY